MEDNLIELLSTIVPDVFRQGSLTDSDPYPNEFFTFWNNASDGASYYDNGENSIIYNYDVNFYSTSPSNTYEKLREAVLLLKAHGYIVSGDGYDVASDENTHTGRGVEVLYFKTID